MSVTLPKFAHTQQVIIDALSERPGEFVPTPDIVRRLYGKDNPETRWSFHQALIRLRKRYPGLEIESSRGYRIRKSA